MDSVPLWKTDEQEESILSTGHSCNSSPWKVEAGELDIGSQPLITVSLRSVWVTPDSEVWHFAGILNFIMSLFSSVKVDQLLIGLWNACVEGWLWTRAEVKHSLFSRLPLQF